MNLNTVSDKIVFSILKDIKVGHLELTNYDGKNYSFGNPKDNLKANIKIKNKNFTFKKISIFENKKLENLIKNNDYIFHFAAQALVRESIVNPINTFKTNTIGTCLILDALKNTKKRVN